MATDEYLLELCSGGGARAALRFYEWEPPAVSLGYSQPSGLLDLEKCRLEGVDVVRRISGGGAILHWQELTYCFVMRRDCTKALRRPREMANAVSGALVAGLCRLGVEAVARGRERERDDPGLPAAGPERARKRRPHGGGLSDVCFASGAENEVEASGRKLAGCAHKLTREVFFSHGSIMTGPAHLKLVELIDDPMKGPSRGVKRVYRKHADQSAPDPRRSSLASEIASRCVSLSELLPGLPLPDELELAFKAAFESVFEFAMRPGRLSSAGERIVRQRAAEKRSALAAAGR